MKAWCSREEKPNLLTDIFLFNGMVLLQSNGLLRDSNQPQCGEVIKIVDSLNGQGWCTYTQSTVIPAKEINLQFIHTSRIK